jgi:pimeloyl-ACP methyl ester carboxylesterase
MTKWKCSACGLCLLLGAGTACGSSSNAPPSAETGLSDAGLPDATSGGIGPEDAAFRGMDAQNPGATEGGSADSGGDAGVFCSELGQVDPLQPVAANIVLPADKGRILACEHTASVTSSDLSANAVLTALGLTALNGYELYTIQYVSEGPVGTVRRVSAMVYAPTGGGGNVTLAAVNHGTSGMGQPCGPSHNAAALSDLEKLTLPVVSQGYAVVATDYQGMGVYGEPLSPYTVGHGEALAVLDAVRAMWRFHDTRFDASQLSGDIFLVGHSQGGQATLFAHQDYDPSVGGRLLGSVSFAPAVGDERLYQYLLGEPLAPTNVVGVVLTMSLYGQAVYYGTPADTWLSASAQQSLPPIFNGQCITEIDQSVPLAEPTVGLMFTPSFVSAGGACGLDGGPCPAFEPWNTELIDDEPGSFTSSVPTLILQGGEDTTVPAPFTSCIQSRLVANNPLVPDLGCLYATATHPTIVVQAMVDALGWMKSVGDGKPPLLCPQLAPLPAVCAPL